MSHHRGKYLGYMLKDSIFLSLLQIISKCILTRADGKNKTKQKFMKLGPQILKSLFALIREFFLDILGEKRSHKTTTI